MVCEAQGEELGAKLNILRRGSRRAQGAPLALWFSLEALGLHSPDVHCGDLGGIVAMAMPERRPGQRAGARQLLGRHLRAISPDFEPPSPKKSKP